MLFKIKWKEAVTTDLVDFKREVDTQCNRRGVQEIALNIHRI